MSNHSKNALSDPHPRMDGKVIITVNIKIMSMTVVYPVYNFIDVVLSQGCGVCDWRRNTAISNHLHTEYATSETFLRRWLDDISD